MSGWQDLNIGSICIKIIDYRGKTPEKVLSGTKLITSKVIKNSRILDNANFEYIRDDKYEEVMRRGKPEFQDILFTTEAPLGEVALIKSDEKIAIAQRIILLRADQDKVIPDFLFYSLRGPIGYNRVQQKGTGTTVLGIKNPELKKVILPIPPLPTQQKIAKILSNYDDLIENNLKRIKLLEESARLTYEEWFLHFRIDGKKLDIDAESGLPFGWKRKSITSIGDVNKYSISVKTAPKKIKYIDISATETGVYRKPDYLEFKDAPSRARRKLNYGDTIFSTVRPNRKIYALVLEDDPTLIASTGFAVITPKDPLHFPYIYLSLSAQCFIDSAVAVAGGAAYPAINQSSFERLEVTVPSENILNKFCDSASFYLKTKNVLLNQNQLLIKARDILLPRLMTGMIDTDDMDVVL